MSERSWMEPIVERVVSQALENHASQLRAEIVRKVMEEVEAQAPTAPQPSATGSADLARAIAEIQTGSSQKEILRALLDNCARYAARCALFVVKGAHASGWQGRGFSNPDALKDFALDAHAAAVTRAITDRIVVSSPVADFDSHFLQEFGAPSSGEAKVLPLLLKDKVAALVYVDAGTDGVGQLDSGSIDLIVLATSAWLEVNSLRKQVHKEPAAETATPAPVAATPAPSAPAFNDPFAAHAPSHAMAAAASAEHSAAVVSASSVATVEEPPATVEPIVEAPEHPAEPPASEVSASGSNEDQDTHRKAQRFARLLVDEIKLYNQAKVAEGRKHKDLYDRLKEAIEKSRATYQKRYGNTVASSGEYFQHELVRSLAEDDISIMGTNFKH